MYTMNHPSEWAKFFDERAWLLSLQAQRFGRGPGYSHVHWEDVEKRRDKCGQKACTKLRKESWPKTLRSGG